MPTYLQLQHAQLEQGNGWGDCPTLTALSSATEAPQRRCRRIYALGHHSGTSADASGQQSRPAGAGEAQAPSQWP